MRTTSPSVTPARAQRALDAHAPQPLLHVGHRFGVGEVGERDRALRRPAVDAPRVVALAHDREALLRRPQHDVRLGLAFARRAPRRPASRPRPRNSSRPGTRDRRDARARRTVRLQSRDVGLAADDDARPVEQLGPVAAAARRAAPRSCSAGAASVDGREVEQEHEHARPLDVAQELVTEARCRSAAPSMSPGMSASTNSWSWNRTTPRWGTSVVNG